MMMSREAAIVAAKTAEMQIKNNKMSRWCMVSKKYLYLCTPFCKKISQNINRKDCNSMIKARLLLCVLTGLLVFSGCSKEEDHQFKGSQAAHEFRLSKSSIKTGYTAGYEHIWFYADLAITWTATTSADWLSVSPTSGTGGSTLTVAWEENPDAADREATVTISEGQAELTLIVRQGQKPAELVSTRAITGNGIKGEKDSVEFVFDRPLGALNVWSGSELYYIEEQTEKMDDKGLRWRMPLRISKQGMDVKLMVAYKSASDWVEHKKGVSVPFYQKKYVITQENEWITYMTLSLDKQSFWIGIDNWEPEKRRLVQVSLDDMQEIKSVKMPYAVTHLCMNPYNGLLYVMGDQEYFCVVDPAKGDIVKKVQIETSPYAHPQYPENCAAEVAFTNDGFGVLRLISPSSTGMEWRYIDSADDDKITLSNYDWSEHQFEHLYVNYDGSRIYASMYPNLYSPMEWVNRQHKKPVEVDISPRFQSDKGFAGGNLMDLVMSPFANKAFICTAPGSECVVTLEPLSYSEVCEEEARDSKCAWDWNVPERDYIYQVCSTDGCLELYDMTEGRGIFGTHHRFIGNETAKNCYFLPATDELVVSSYDGVWVLDAAAMKAKKL